ncbi:MAG: hypothetical protein ACREO8_10080 [Luteimonas sp.]
MGIAAMMAGMSGHRSRASALADASADARRDPAADRGRLGDGIANAIVAGALSRYLNAAAA